MKKMFIFRYTTTVRVSEQQPYQVREYVWCMNFPPRCSKYKIKFKTVYKTQNLMKTRPVEECCKGYAKSSSEDRCIPVCSDDCLHGTCVAPDTCQCETGYGGPSCDICKYRLILFGFYQYDLLVHVLILKSLATNILYITCNIPNKAKHFRYIKHTNLTISQLYI